MGDGKQASRLFALAISARERGDHFAADELMKLGLEALGTGKARRPAATADTAQEGRVGRLSWLGD